MRLRWPVLVGLVVIGLLVWLWRSSRSAQLAHDDHDSSSGGERATAGSAARSSTTKPGEPGVPTPSSSQAQFKRSGYEPPEPGPFDAAAQHTADPCTALAEPVIPDGFEQVTENGITVAWQQSEVSGPFDVPLRPVALAHAIGGVLEEAAQLTGTDRRQHLTVVVDATAAGLRQRMKAPEWVHGVYDGGAVHIPAERSSDLGVSMSTLRHEVMHAQMHATIGCTPFWFNEGMASYFAGSTPHSGWFAMLRAVEPFDMTSVADPEVFALRKETATRMYAVGLAMVVYLVHRSGESALRDAVVVAQRATSKRDALDLWERIAPGVDYRAVVESLAKRVFNLSLGGELDQLLRGGICCRGLRSPAELACRAMTPGEERFSKGDLCRPRW